MRDGKLWPIALSGLITGYAATVLQLTHGPGGSIAKLRKRYIDLCKRSKRHPVIRSMKELAECGWCLSPYLAVIIYPTVRIALRAPKQTLPELVIGLASATSLGAFMRHLADIY